MWRSFSLSLLGLELVFNRNSEVLDIGLLDGQNITEKAQQCRETFHSTRTPSWMLYVGSLSSCKYIERYWLAFSNPNPNPRALAEQYVTLQPHTSTLTTPPTSSGKRGPSARRGSTRSIERHR
jgi:hypothetical protein